MLPTITLQSARATPGAAKSAAGNRHASASAGAPNQRSARGLAQAYSRLLRHRVCTPEDRDVVVEACLRDRRVLPRYHQDDRGHHRLRYGHHELAPAGAYAGVVAWSSRDHWLTFTVPLVHAMRPEQARKFHINPATLRRFVQVKSGYAAPRTGRRCIVRPDTLASVVGVSARTVQTYNAYLRAVGLEVVITPGRMLNRAEKLALWREGIRGRGAGSRQRGLSTETALTVPRFLFAKPTHFTPGSTSGTYLEILTLDRTHHGGQAESEPASPAQHRRRRPPPPDRDAVRLARRLRGQFDWLRNESVARMAPALTRFAHSPLPWNATNLALAIADARARAGITCGIDAARIHTRPAAVLAYWLRQIDPVDDHPDLPHATAADLRCNRPECDHGWLTTDPVAYQLHLLLGTKAPPVIRCDRCHPGAWSTSDDDADSPFDWDPDEPPF